MEGMRRLLACALLAGLATGCVRVELDGAAAGAPEALILSEPGAVVLCPVAVAPSADGASYAVLWQEYPADDDVVRLMYARVAADGALEVAPAPVASLDGELQGLSLVAIDGGFAVGLARYGDGQRSALAIDDAGVLWPEAAIGGELDELSPVASNGDIACRAAVEGPGETASASRAQVGGQLRLVLSLH